MFIQLSLPSPIIYHLDLFFLYNARKNRQTTGQRKVRARAYNISTEAAFIFFSEGILFLLMFSTNTLHNTLSKPLAAFTSMLLGRRSMGHIITGKGQGRMIFIKITCMTCSVHCEQQSGTYRCLHFPSSSRFLFHHPLLTFWTCWL